jgi:hypothetical protein
MWYNMGMRKVNRTDRKHYGQNLTRRGVSYGSLMTALEMADKTPYATIPDSEVTNYST